MKQRPPIFALFLLCLAPFAVVLQPYAQQQAQEVLMPLEELVIETGLGTFTFKIEVADEEQERTIGLMFRTEMPINHGMLFDFGATGPIAMWMQNTVLPLDMIFIEPDGKVLRIEHNTTPFSREVISSGGPVSHVLEVNAGVAKQIGLKVGDRILHPDFGTSD